VEPGNLLSKYVGESENNIRKIFEKAKKEKTIVFIDEIDSFGRARKADEASWERNQKTQLLESIQDFFDDMQADSALMACTNTLDQLDHALLRRFRIHIFCGLPTEDERRQLLVHYAKNFSHNLTQEDFADIAKKTDYFSGSDMARLCDIAKMGPVAELQTATHFRQTDQGLWTPCTPEETQATLKALKDIPDDQLAPKRSLSKEDFENALKKCKATLTKQEYDKYLKMSQSDQAETTTRLDSMLQQQRTAFQRELEMIFCSTIDKNSPDSYFELIRQFERFSALATDSQTATHATTQTALVVVIFVLLLLALLVPYLVWLLLALYAAYYFIACVFGPLLETVWSIFTNISNAQENVNILLSQNLQHLSGLLVFIVCIVGNFSFLRYSGIKFVDDLVLALFFNMSCNMLAYLCCFILLLNLAETKRLVKEAREAPQMNAQLLLQDLQGSSFPPGVRAQSPSTPTQTVQSQLQSSSTRGSTSGQ